MSNRLQLVEREIISQQVEGVDFGGDLYLIARSPTAVLVWARGNSYSVNGHQHYGESHLTVLYDRTMHARYHPTYRDIGGRGGRLSWRRVQDGGVQLAQYFTVDDVGEIIKAVRLRKTLIIEGGGPPLMPARSLGHEAYIKWRDLPSGGLVNPELSR